MHKNNVLIVFFIVVSVITALIIADTGYPVFALGWVLLSAIVLLSQVESYGHRAKTSLTITFGCVAFFIYITFYGISRNISDNSVLDNLQRLAHSVHLEIFIFLAGLYMVVNTFSYSGLIGDTAWRIVKKTKGKLGATMVSIMFFTCILSGLFDGATIASIMGVVTLTILLSSGMKVPHIVKILLLLVVATNIGGVWFVLGEPTNILAAEKLKLTPFYFLRYALPFALPAVGFCAFMAWRIVRKCPPIQSDRPEIEVLLEGISLRRTHHGTGTLLDTLNAIGNVELRHLKETELIIKEESIPDFEAALKAGVPQQCVYEALSINLNSDELAAGLIDYYISKNSGNPMAHLIIGDLLHHVRIEYSKRLQSRRLVILSGVLLISLLIFHALFSDFPTWMGTIIAGIVAILAVQKNARKLVLHQTWENISEAFFLIAIFAIISEINLTGAFNTLGELLLNAGSPLLVGMGILTGSAVLSSITDNIAVMDVVTNLISNHHNWSFFALAGIIGTALGGFVSPIASVQAVIIASILQRVSRLNFGQWILLTAKWFFLLLICCLVLLMAAWFLELPPEMPLPAVDTGGH